MELNGIECKYSSYFIEDERELKNAIVNPLSYMRKFCIHFILLLTHQIQQL